MRLRFHGGPLAGQTIEVSADRFVLGRSSDTDLPLADEKVSRRHAEIVRRGDGWIVRDLGSSNGTFVDERTVTGDVALRGGETLRLGGHTASVDVDGPPAPAARSAPRARGYTTLLRRTDQRVRRALIVAGAAVLIAAAVGVAALTGVLGGGDDDLDVRALVGEATPSTLWIGIHVGDETVGNGTGWVFDAGAGEIVTNGHVAAAGIDVSVSLPGAEEREAEIVGMDVCQDVALLRTPDTTGLRTMPRAHQTDIAAGDPVVALGFPGTLSPDDNLVTTTGVVSVVETRDETGLYPDVVQTDAAINGGNSGGPLLDAEGRVIGMNTFAATEKQNQNYAIATDFVERLLPALRDGESSGWHGLALEWPQDEEPLGYDGDRPLHGPRIAAVPPGAGGDITGPRPDGTEQWLTAVDGQSFGFDEGAVPPVEDGICALTKDKATGETSTVGVLEKGPDGSLSLFDATVTYR